MSEKKIEVETDAAVCSQCNEWLKDARVLPCLHSFCLSCLESHVHVHSNKKVFKCPKCTAEVYRPKGGVTNLPKNVFLTGLRGVFEAEKAKENSVECDNCNYEGQVDTAEHSCLDCQEYLCNNCSKIHCRTKPTRQHLLATLSDIAAHKHQQDIRDRQKIPCSSHPEENVGLYCISCDKVICMLCTSEEHEDHPFSPCPKAVKEYTPAVKASVQDARKRLPKLTEIISEVERSDSLQHSHCDEIVAEIKKREEVVHDLVKKFAKNLIEEVTKAQENNDTGMKKTNQELTLIKSAIEDSTAFAENLIAYGKPEEVMYLGQLTDTRLRALKNSPLPECPMITRFNFKSAAASNKMLASVFGRLDKDCNREPSALADAPREVGQSSGNQKSPFHSKQGGGGGGSETTSSTKVIKAKLLEEFTVGGMVMGMSSFWNGNLAVAVQGNLHCTDNEAGYEYFICVFTVDGQRKSKFRIRNPVHGIAVLNDNIIVAVDGIENEVIFFQVDGRVEHHFPCPDPGPVAVNNRSHIIVAGSYGVHVFDENGEKLLDIEDRVVGSAASHLSRFICCNQHCDIFITDPLEHCIRGFSKDGEHILSYGSQGSKSGQFNGPCGIVADSENHLIVADSGNSRIRFLTLDEEMKSSVITKDKGIEYPKCIALSSHGQLAVSEQYTDKVRVFEYL